MKPAPGSEPLPPRGVILSQVSPALKPGSVEQRSRVVPIDDENRSPVLVEVDLTRDPDTEQTRTAFLGLYERVFPRGPQPIRVAASYLRCLLSPDEIQLLLQQDQESSGRPTVFRVWPDYTMDAHIDRSVSTIKADAVARCYASSGLGIVWAVMDSGIDEHHPHFAEDTLQGQVSDLHRDFTGLVPDGPADPAEQPLTDPAGHGTHVAGIIAGGLPPDSTPLITRLQLIGGLPVRKSRELAEGRSLRGIAPRAQLVSLKVLAQRGDSLVTSSSAVIEALYYLREKVNTGGRLLVVHGVNLSLGCPWDAAEYACGQSPVCREVNLLAASGVVVVVSAGNGGFGTRVPGEGGTDTRGVLASITDPGNADGAITVGSTHRDRPHEYGVTYNSSKGPTLDGRLKPDLLAPGERITSCATGGLRGDLAALLPAGADPAAVPVYTEQSGTSMAAPHVSGAVAAFLSVRPEFIGRPREIKELFCANATSLGRDRYLEGHGLLDLMRVMSNI
ncbi:subtilase family protein [Streptomyces sp. TLI_235]|nr:S8 family serine peptidase [Streptomyces sp. TLI_235]PBC75501.1 subtilase family protein [Streptomyces sp. TLI_235]